MDVHNQMENVYTVSFQPTLSTHCQKKRKKRIVIQHVVMVTKILSSLEEKMLGKIRG